MNDKGKFKRLTVILMIVSVVISVISLAWVIIFRDEDQYERTNKEFYEQTSSVRRHTQVTDNSSDSDEMFNVEITVPVSFVLENINSDSRLTDEQKDKIFGQIALKRFGEVSEIASTVSFLLSEEASYITGQTIEISGGLAM